MLFSQYLSTFCCSTDRLDCIERMMTRHWIKRIMLRTSLATRQYIAPANEQRRIVAKIEELFSDLDAGVAALERVKAKLKRYRAAVLKAAVEGKLTEEWRKKNRPKETGQQLLDRILQERRRTMGRGTTGEPTRRQERSRQRAGKTSTRSPLGPDESSLPELPEGWCWASAGQVARGATAEFTKRPKRTWPHDASDPFLRVANVYRGSLELSEVQRTNIHAEEHEDSSCLQTATCC